MANLIIQQIEECLSNRQKLLEGYYKSFDSLNSSNIEITEEIKELESDVVFKLCRHCSCCLQPDYIIETLAKIGYSPMLISNDENQFLLTKIGYFTSTFVTGIIADEIWSVSIKDAVINYLNKLFQEAKK